MFSRYALSTLPTIRLPRAVVDAVRKEFEEGKVKMEGFHLGMPEFEKEERGVLSLVRSPVHEEKMMAFVKHGKKTLVVFGRMGPTNFAHSPTLLAEGVPAFCSEQIFKLLCACTFLGKSANCNEVMRKILLAAKPFAAKSATTKLLDFDAVLWDSKSEGAMYVAILFICTNPETFARFKAFAAMLDTEELLVVEANDDKIWGINMFTKPFLDALCEKMTPESDLFEEARSLFGGTNKLGQVLTVVLDTIRTMEYEEFMKAVEPFKFVEIVEEKEAVEEKKEAEVEKEAVPA